MTEREIRYCTTSDGVRIAYAVAGQGPLLVMTPAFIESFSLFHLVPEVELFLAKLQEVRRVVLFDRRGSGLSQRDVTFGRDAVRWDIEAVIAALDEGPVALWANFVSSVPASLRIAADEPEVIERLIVCGGSASPVFTDDQFRSLADLARVNWPLAAQTFGDMSSREADPAAGIRWGKLFRESSSGNVVAAYFTSRVDDPEDARDCLSRITVPTLVLHRKGDLTVPIDFGRQIAAAIPRARFIPLDGVMTHPAAGDQEAVLRAALPFLHAPDKTADARSDVSGALRTVLFTDFVGHTEMMSRLGDERGRDVLREHERITREVLKAHGGTEVKTMGDGFMASFGSVTKAVECAVALQRAIGNWQSEIGERIEVRCGLNAGEPIAEEGDLFGATVILAARIAARAEGGEVLVSDNVRSLCAGKGFLFSDRGEFVAKGFEEPVRVWAVRPFDSPAARTAQDEREE